MDVVRERIERFVLDNLLLGDDSRMPAGKDSLIEHGVVDSTGILELIEFLEEEFGVRVEDIEALPENLDGIDRVTDYVLRKSAIGVR